MSIESKGFTSTTPAEISDLTKKILAGANTVTEGRGTYLKCVVGNTVEELGARPRANLKQAKKLKPPEIAVHLTALEAVHGRFYAAVVEAASEHLPPGKAGVKELQRRTNFARSSMSTVRSYIRAGNDITALVPGKIVKAALAVPRQVRPVSQKRLRAQVEKLSKAIMSKVIALSEVDKITAIGELETLMGQLAAQLEDLGVMPVTDARQAAEEHKPLRAKGAKGSVFIPVTRSQVIRQQARPS